MSGEQIPVTSVTVDGRELTGVAWQTYDMVRYDHIGLGARRWQADRTPPDPIGWHWLGQATTGEHLYWMPLPAREAGS